MNIFIHEDFKKEQRRQLRRRSLLGIGLFFVSFILSFASLSPSTEFLIFLAYPFLLIGVPLWMSARSAERRLTAGPQADALINEQVKGLSNKYSLHHYPRVGDTWIPHLFIMPAGVLVMASNDALGPITCKGGEKGDKWHTPLNLLDRATGSKPQVGNPSLELDAQVAVARALIDSIGKTEVPVKGLVIFTRNPDIEVSGCSYGAAPVNELRSAIRDLELAMGEDREGSSDVRTILTNDDRRKLNNLLAPVSIPASAKQEKTRPAAAKRKA
jgi:hypothetical protein